MRQQLLYIVSSEKLADAISSMHRLGAQPISSASTHAKGFLLSHKRLGHLSLEITMLTSLNDLSSHIRQYPVDLLVYDERFGGVNAVTAVKRIRQEVQALAETWGPDFDFPASRIVVVLKKSRLADHTLFELGRQEVRDILVDPQSTAKVLRWIFGVLYAGVIRENRVGCALSGGGLDGFLFQIGVLYALNQALAERSIYEIDVVSGAPQVLPKWKHRIPAPVGPQPPWEEVESCRQHCHREDCSSRLGFI